MDIYCPNAGCAEPMDNDCLHDAVDEGLFDSYHNALRAFQSQGCPAIGYTCSTGNNSGRAEAMSALYDLLGDDADGAAAMMEDYGYMFD